MIELPDFKIDKSLIPTIKLKSITFKNFKIFDDYSFDFTVGDKQQSFVCFFGPNGCGKTTVLEIIQLIFSRFEGYGKDRLKYYLGKSVRHVDGKRGGIYGDDDFLITAQITSSLGDYEIQLNKNGFIKDHPAEIKSIVYRLCFFARFDQELHQFNLPRDKWDVFKDLFESVTGFEIEEKISIFDESVDPVQADILNQYVLGFLVKKPYEIINHTECSAGERKIIKSFSTLLSKEYNPQIILIDNMAMHVESGRHIDLVKATKRCFPTSQIFSTTHSYQISRNFGDRSQLYDLRLVRVTDILKNEPWRLYLIDEVRDCLSKLRATTFNKEEVGKEILFGENLLRQLSEKEDDKHLLQADAEQFFQRTAHFFTIDVIKYYFGKRESNA